MPKPWTKKQNEILLEEAANGVLAVRKRLREECHVDRTPKAIRNHASALHIRFKAKNRCPLCGEREPAGHKTGLCSICDDVVKAQARDLYNAWAASVDPVEARKEYERARKDCQRKRQEGQLTFREANELMDFKSQVIDGLLNS